MSFRHLPARSCREWLARCASRALLLGCCSSVGCAPLGDLGSYSSSGDRLDEPPTGRDDSAPGAPPDSLELDAGPGADTATGTRDAATPAAAGPPLAADAASAPALLPRVSSSVPADGATGVRRDTSLSIAFSQPMDRASVEAAFVSDSLPAAAPEFHWDSAGMLLNIVLAAPLNYAAGNDPSLLSALRYGYRVTSVARDLAGHALPETQVSFSTLREIHVGLSALGDASLSGNWRSDDIFGTDPCSPTGTQICVGDSSFGPNASYQGFISFDLSPLAAPQVELSDAQFSIQIGSILGNPFGGLGQLELERAAFAAIGPDAFRAPTQAPLGGVTATASGEVLSFGVTAAARSDLTSGSRSQYRLLFHTGSDGDGSTDLLFFTRTSATLQVSYLVP